MLDSIYLAGFLMVSAVVMLICLIRQHILLRGLAFSAVSGLASLWIVSLLSGILNLGIAFNLLSACTAVIYGIPGVVGMLLLRALCL